MGISKKVTWLLTLVMCLALIATPAMAEKVLKIGVMGPFTGPAAKTGSEFKGSTTMAFEEIGYKIGDYKVEIVWIDSQSDPAKATNALAEAIEKGNIQVGMNNWHSSVAMASMDVVAQYKVPFLFGFGATDGVNKKWHADKKYHYWSAKAWPTPQKLMGGYVQTIDHYVKLGVYKPATKKVAVCAEETDWGRSCGDAFEKEFKAIGWDVVYADYFDPKQTDFYGLLSKYKKAGVSVMATSSGFIAAVSALYKQKKEIGFDALVVGDGLGWIGDWYKMTGRSSNGILDMIPQLGSKKAKAWAKAFKKKTGSRPSPSAAGLCYDWTRFGIKILKHTFDKYGVLDREHIYKVMIEEVNTGKLTYTDAEGAIIMKRYRFSDASNPDPVIGPDDFFFPVIQYKGGKGKIVFPVHLKEAEFMTK